MTTFQHASISTGRPATSKHTASLSDQARLVDAWRHEIMHVAMKSAFVTMGCNAMIADRCYSNFPAILGHLPEESSIHRAVSQGLLELPPHFRGALNSVQDAYEKLGAASAAFCSASAELQLNRDGSVFPASITDLAHSWRSVCALFVDALSECHRVGAIELGGLENDALSGEWHRRLDSILRDAASGETTARRGLAGPLGELPSCVQRRRWKRIEANIRATVVVGGSNFAATIRNISMGGALLQGLYGLRRGTMLLISTADRRSLRGTVAWASGASAGIKFDQALSHNDPLLAANETDEGCDAS